MLKIKFPVTLFLLLAAFLFSFNISNAATLLTDDFTGTTINTSKWSELDAGGAGGSSGNVQQNGSLTISNFLFLMTIETASFHSALVPNVVAAGISFLIWLFPW